MESTCKLQNVKDPQGDILKLKEMESNNAKQTQAHSKLSDISLFILRVAQIGFLDFFFTETWKTTQFQYYNKSLLCW